MAIYGSRLALGGSSSGSPLINAPIVPGGAVGGQMMPVINPGGF